MKIMFYESNEGFSSYTHCLANYTRRNDYHADVVYLTPSDNIYLNCVDNDIITCSKLLPYKKRNDKNTLSWALDRTHISLKNILARNAIVKKEKPDIVSIQCTTPILDQFFIQKLKKYSKVVYTAHDVIPPLVSKNWSLSSLYRIYHTVDHIIVHSEANKKQLVEKFSLDECLISIIHHGVKIGYIEIDRYIERKKLGISEDDIVVLFYGLIRPQKGLDNLIKSLDGINVTLLIAGNMPCGESFEQYDKLLAKHNINSIRFIEFISEEFTNILFQICDVVALPYKYFYSQSGVFMQAIQYHKPVVVTDTAAFSEYILKYGLGILCEPDDVASLREAFIKITGEKNILSKLASNMNDAAEDNSWTKSALMHMEVFHDLLK